MAVLVLIAAVIGGVALLIRHFDREVNGQLADATLCQQAASGLNVPPPPSLPGGAMAVVRLVIVKTTAEQVVVEYATASEPAHPWDQEPPGTPVLRCESRGLTWFVDRHGHATILSTK